MDKQKVNLIFAKLTLLKNPKISRTKASESFTASQFNVPGDNETIIHSGVQEWMEVKSRLGVSLELCMSFIENQVRCFIETTYICYIF